MRAAGSSHPDRAEPLHQILVSDGIADILPAVGGLVTISCNLLPLRCPTDGDCADRDCNGFDHVGACVQPRIVRSVLSCDADQHPVRRCTQRHRGLVGNLRQQECTGRRGCDLCDCLYLSDIGPHGLQWSSADGSSRVDDRRHAAFTCSVDRRADRGAACAFPAVFASAHLSAVCRSTPCCDDIRCIVGGDDGSTRDDLRRCAFRPVAGDDWQGCDLDGPNRSLADCQRTDRGTSVFWHRIPGILGQGLRPGRGLVVQFRDRKSKRLQFSQHLFVQCSGDRGTRRLSTGCRALWGCSGNWSLGLAHPPCRGVVTVRSGRDDRHVELCGS